MIAGGEREERERKVYLQGSKIRQLQIRKRTNQVVQGKSKSFDCSVGAIADDTKPGTCARVRCSIPVGIVRPGRATSGAVEVQERGLLRRGKGAGDREEEGQE